jgi:hypothetical protein
MLWLIGSIGVKLFYVLLCSHKKIVFAFLGAVGVMRQHYSAPMPETPAQYAVNTDSSELHVAISHRAIGGREEIKTLCEITLITILCCVIKTAKLTMQN